MDKYQKRTKIIATVGPACNNKEMLGKLIDAGVNIFRLNFSHGDHAGHANVISFIRELNKEKSTNVAILQDLQGPKIRTGEVENNGVLLVDGNELIITTEKVIGNSKKIYTTYKSMPQDVKVGDSILIDDGNIEIKVDRITGIEVICKVVHGGVLKSKKGINLPNTNVSEPSLTEKDREDLEFGLVNDVDWIALSFVRNAIDITELKDIIKARGKSSKVIAKIEKPEALANIDEIIEVSDALMVARGDLGVEVNFEDVPIAQKKIIRKCNFASKPVIVATQMMESMITNPRPTRAEANDVANAVMDGADTVMLSAETAAGQFPVQVINAMSKIIKSVEDNVDIFNKNYDYDADSKHYYNENVIAAGCNLASSVNAQAIIGISKSGFTALKLSSHRPESKIFIFTDDNDLVNKLSLSWGVTAFFIESFEDTTDKSFKKINKILLDKGYLNKGDVVVNTGSMPIVQRSLTNMVKLSIIE